MKLFSFLVLSFFSFSSIAQSLNWTPTATGDNMTVLINLTNTPTVLGNPITAGDSIGVFFENTLGDTICGGSTIWNGDPTQAISFPAYEDDNGTTDPDGFETGDSPIWKLKTVSNNTDYDLTVVYDTDAPFINTYLSDGFMQITEITVQAGPIIQGCTDPDYLEYDPTANVDDGSCATLIVEGCTDEDYLEYNPNANVDDGSCATLIVEGCTDEDYLEFDPNANVDDGSCVTLIVEGCTDAAYLEYNPNANVDDGSCATLIVLGCTDTNYLEYDPLANVDDGSCATLIVEGCMDPDAENYNPNANVDDGSCDYFCDPGEVEIVVTITQQNNTGAFWSLTANSTNQLATQSGTILVFTGDKVHRFCVAPGTELHFNSTDLVGFSITQCGETVDPSTTNPEEAFFIADCTFGLDEESEIQDVFPNPTSGLIQGSSDELWNTIRFINTLGQELKSYKPTQTNWKVDVSDLPNGLYTLQFESDTKRGMARVIVRK